MPYPYNYNYPNRSDRHGFSGPVPGTLENNMTYASVKDSFEVGELIDKSIERILHTTPGERVMLPEFGSRLRSLVFEPNDITLENEIRRAVIEPISRWEPRVEVSYIDVQRAPDLHEVHITLQYKLKKSGEDRVLKINLIK